MKGLIASSMARSDSSLRVLFATEAYGMGADAPDVRDVVHIGVPSSLDSKFVSNMCQVFRSQNGSSQNSTNYSFEPAQVIYIYIYIIHVNTT